MSIKRADMDYISAETKEFLGLEFNFDPDSYGGLATARENLRVGLIYKPAWKDWVRAAFYSAFTTWNSGNEIDIEKIKERNRAKIVVDFVKKRPVSAVLESAVFVFRIENLSRAMTHQIVRHRNMSFNQESFRVTPAHHKDIRISDDIDAKQKAKISAQMNELRNLYVELIEDGIPIEQARAVLPMGTCTNITATANLKALIDYFKARTSGITQDEHTFMVAKMLKVFKEQAPEFYENFISTPALEDIITRYAV